MSDELKRSPLCERQRQLGATFVEFAGWSMPLNYTSIIAEHTAVRERVGLFDVSHLGKVVIHGRGAKDFVDSCLTNALSAVSPGGAQYTLCCDDSTGGVIDDLIVYVRSGDEIVAIPNAANNDDVVQRLRSAAPSGIRITDHHHDYAILAVQGPHTAEVLKALSLPTNHTFMSFAEGMYANTPITVARTGYTGEHGYELMIPSDGAERVWDALLEAGEDHGITACGLGARDTLRTEMGYPLHGQDLTPDITPVEAGLSWAVGWSKPTFWGKSALAAQKDAGPTRRLRGIKAQGAGIPRPGMRLTVEGAPVGTVTSGTFSPTLRQGIGLALMATTVSLGDEVNVDIRGRDVPFDVVRPPFVSSRPH